MGIDIRIFSDSFQSIAGTDIDPDKQEKYYSLGTLSRNFCHFMLGRGRLAGRMALSELDEIGKRFQIDVEVLFDMNTMPTENEIDTTLEFDPNLKKHKEVLSEYQVAFEKLKGNIEIVDNAVQKIAAEAEAIYSMRDIFDYGDKTISLSPNYFSCDREFALETSPSSLKADLNLIISFLEFAKDDGATTVWFDYG